MVVFRAGPGAEEIPVLVVGAAQPELYHVNPAGFAADVGVIGRALKQACGHVYGISSRRRHAGQRDHIIESEVKGVGDPVRLQVVVYLYVGRFGLPVAGLVIAARPDGDPGVIYRIKRRQRNAPGAVTVRGRAPMRVQGGRVVVPVAYSVVISAHPDRVIVAPRLHQHMHPYYDAGVGHHSVNGRRAVLGGEVRRRGGDGHGDLVVELHYPARSRRDMRGQGLGAGKRTELPVIGQVIGVTDKAVVLPLEAGNGRLQVGGEGIGPGNRGFTNAVRRRIHGGLEPDWFGRGEGFAVPPVAALQEHGHPYGISPQAGLVNLSTQALVAGLSGNRDERIDELGRRREHGRGGFVQVELGNDARYGGIIAGQVGGYGLILVAVVTCESQVGIVV